MSRPTLTDIASGQESWDTTINANQDKLTAAPLPVVEYATLAALNSGAPASSYDRCVAATADGLYWVSDGTQWVPLSGIVRVAAERAVGYDHVNSKVIYAQSYSFLLANAGAQTQAHGVTGLAVAEGSLSRVDAVASDGTTIRVLPWQDATDRLEVTVDATNITITSTKDESSVTAVVTLYYTK